MEAMKGFEAQFPLSISKGEVASAKKPPFRIVQDDTKPIFRDPILRSDPIETEQAVLRLPPFPFDSKGTPGSKP
ncbi:uncharacterized protein LOC18439350 [Amborella trichopoda]|uniref:Uncharacterized protein n=1 Tax=Amborella trichopoda TaxID=13333 RepID=W1PV65_AMBTC|nr:uncharacterized protein LOC18439350 [Amborella trichopoda]XP_020526192.1 uncharacterized protein LOC18439350 [Amborella trichopoda]ERN11160.1 hypothetical protein AMTR_s00024p00192050 [Amborella trichopoda]|eukprot:XP_006849579.1 uncharacterized protein LOC18439350 [Amborella trichopoda]